MSLCNAPQECACDWCECSDWRKPLLENPPIGIQEWRQLGPRHEEAYQKLKAGIESGTIIVQGEQK